MLAHGVAPRALVSLSSALALAAVGLAQNDDCAGAIALGVGISPSFSNVGATTSAVPVTCGNMANDVWFSHTATCTGNLTVSTCIGSSFDTVLEVFDGSCGALRSLGCDDDSCNVQSSLVVPATSGTTYFIRVGGYSGAVGSFQLVLSCTTGGAADDSCTGATALTVGVNGPFSTTGYTTSAPSWPCANGGNDRWFTFTPTFTGAHTISTCTPARTYDTAIEVFTGTCAALSSLQCNDDSCGFGSSVQVNLTAGTPCFVRVGGFGGATGTTEVEVSLGNGTGSIRLAAASGCGNGTLTFAGTPALGTSFTATLGNVTGAPLLGMGFVNPAQLFCGCTFGVDWSIVQFGSATTFAVPANPTYLGVTFFIQGADFGATGGCGFVLYTLTDSYEVTIG